MKAMETYEVELSSLVENAVELAVGNAFRKRGRRRVELWKRLSPKRVEPPVPPREFKAIRDHFRKVSRGKQARKR